MEIDQNAIVEKSGKQLFLKSLLRTLLWYTAVIVVAALEVFIILLCCQIFKEHERFGWNETIVDKGFLSIIGIAVAGAAGIDFLFLRSKPVFSNFYYCFFLLGGLGLVSGVLHLFMMEGSFQDDINHTGVSKLSYLSAISLTLFAIFIKCKIFISESEHPESKVPKQSSSDVSQAQGSGTQTGTTNSLPNV
jgi:hypothetical protein